MSSNNEGFHSRDGEEFNSQDYLLRPDDSFEGRYNVGDIFNIGDLLRQRLLNYNNSNIEIDPSTGLPRFQMDPSIDPTISPLLSDKNQVFPDYNSLESDLFVPGLDALSQLIHAKLQELISDDTDNNDQKKQENPFGILQMPNTAFLSFEEFVKFKLGGSLPDGMNMSTPVSPREMLKDLKKHQIASEINDEKLLAANSAQERARVTKLFAEYVESDNIKNVILVDNAARPMYIGIRKALKESNPDRKLPKIFFLKPVAVSMEDAEEFQQYMFKNIQTGDDESVPPYLREQKLRDEKILVIDTCVHTGKSLNVIRSNLENAGFRNIEFAVVSNPSKSRFPLNLVALEGLSVNNCYPFGVDTLMRNNLEYPLAEVTLDQENREMGFSLRKNLSKKKEK